MARKPSDSPYVVRDSYNHVDLSDLQSTLDHSIWFYMYATSPSRSPFVFRHPIPTVRILTVETGFYLKCVHSAAKVQPYSWTTGSSTLSRVRKGSCSSESKSDCARSVNLTAIQYSHRYSPEKGFPLPTSPKRESC